MLISLLVLAVVFAGTLAIGYFITRERVFSLSMAAVWTLVVFGALTLACTPPTGPSSPVVVNVNNIQGGNGATATPTVAPGGGAIVFVRTGFFGGRCTSGGDVKNGQPLPIGCTGFATATPLGAGDVKLGPEVHGYECRWTTDRPDVVSIAVSGDNPFNADVTALRSGTAHISATVKGVVGGFDVVVP